jgi:hypothetical protein
LLLYCGTHDENLPNVENNQITHEVVTVPNIEQCLYPVPLLGAVLPNSVTPCLAEDLIDFFAAAAGHSGDGWRNFSGRTLPIGNGLTKCARRIARVVGRAL